MFRLFVLACLVLGCSLTGCKKKTKLSTFDEGFKNYIYAYTSGVISRASPVRIRFTQDLVDDEKIGEAVESGILDFEPSIKGTAIWEDTKTLKFDPEAFMSSNREFLGTINLEKLFDKVPSDLKKFMFDFRTKEQFVEVMVEGLRSEDGMDLKTQKLVGTVFTADVADKEKVEKLLNAKQSGNSNLKINWEHDADQMYHHFVVENVNRGNKPSKVNLKWNGRAIDVKNKGGKEIEVPALNDFRLMDVSIQQEEDQFILLEFSDPLSKTQDLTGLVQIGGVTTPLNHTIDGNTVRVYPSSRISGSRRISVARGIENSRNRSMKLPTNWSLTFAELKPKVKLIGSGTILPNSDGLILPFEAVSLNAVDIEVLKIYESNILQFLQTNDLDGNSQLERVGRIVAQKRISLKAINPNANFSNWTRYALDLKDLIKQEPNAIYQIRLGFKRSYSTFFCSKTEANAEEEDSDEMALVEETQDGEIESFWDKRHGYYSWSHRDDPCHDAYYKSYYRTEKFARQNVISSNLGIIAKKGGDGSYFVAVSDLKSTKPLSGIAVKFYDYQQQLIYEHKTDGEGIIFKKLPRKPHFLVASNGGQRGYLKLQDGNALSLSRYDVSGQKTYKGLKGFLYGERGVWRPGDSLYLTFILEDKLKTLPKNHPVTFELFDARGQLQQKTTTSRNVNNMYNFSTATSREAPTGNWRAKVSVGGAKFEKRIKVETVKPNRLKIALDFGKDEISGSDSKLEGNLQVNWLHGAPARKLRTEVKMKLRTINTTFDNYNNYEFDDPARTYKGKPQTVFDKTVDDNGSAFISASLTTNNTAPGKMEANFSTRAYEKSGDFSTDNFTMSFNPYNTYVGVQIPTKKSGEKRLDLGKSYNLNFVALSDDGKAKRNRQLKVGLYRVNWRWWWDSNNDDVTNFSTSTHFGALEKQNISTNSRGEVQWTAKVDEWGRYLVRVCDEESGHCSGDFFYAGYPYDDDDNKQAAAMLTISAEKETYNVGQTVKLKVPIGEAGRALVTIENGSRVLETYWKTAKKGENTFSFTATKEMTPNIYAHVTMIQPHAQTVNDLPIRMYGVVPVKVEDPKTRLQPLVKMPSKLAPNQSFAIKVSEQRGKPMAYTVAMVDEGLLDLTRHATPSPWDNFYAKEALGVKTWDLYDQVMGAYSGKLERILSIGGDDALGPRAGQKANRFKPVVRHLGPFYLKRGQTATHKIKMPNYIGSVRTMVVAADNGAYGKGEVTTPVKTPLMVFGTLPRVLSPTESLKLPVTVFAMENNVKEVTVSIKPNSLFKVVGPSTKVVNFDKIGDQIVNFDIQVREAIGIGRVTVTAKSGNKSANQKIELEVRNPNPYVANVIEKTLEKGKSWNTAFAPVGIKGTNTGILEVSNIPPINLGKRLDYLLQYPHGCIEQTTSSGFPQLYVSRLMELDKGRKKQIDKNVQATINRLKLFQVASGGFSYWPGDSEASHWGSTYAGHFMLEAKKRGYTVPKTMVNRWVQYQKKIAKTWLPSTADHGYYDQNLMQAYRLYTLAMAKKPDWGAMNRLRESRNLSAVAKWRLAAAYAAGGKTSVAKKIINRLPTKVKKYRELGYTYGSDLRDKAMILETLTLMKQRTKATAILKQVSAGLSNGEWYSTQTVSYGLLAVGKYVGADKVSDKFAFKYKIGSGSLTNAGSSNPIVQYEVDVDGMSSKSRKVSLQNTSGGVLFARLILKGQPMIGDETAAAANLNMGIKYKTLTGEPINVANIQQGTDFIAEVTITNPGQRGNYDEMALTQIFPSGWEIHNTRMDNVKTYSNTTTPEYQDIRDDRVYTYFDIKSNKTQIYRIQLNAAYQGRFYLPTLYCEAMYDNDINARQPGTWVNVGEPLVR